MRLQCGLVALAAVLPVSLAAQDLDAPRRGIQVGLEVVSTPTWSLEVRTGTFVNRQATYDAGATVGLRVTGSPDRRIGIFGSAQWDGGGFGDSSGFSVLEAGVQWRFPTGTRLVPRLVVAGGKFSESGGTGFYHVGGGAGADLFLTRAFLLTLEARGLTSVGTTNSRNTGGESVTVDAGMMRIHFGVGVHF